MNTQQGIVDRIREQAKKSGLKLSFLCDLCVPGGYNPSYLSEVSRGKRRISAEVINNFAEVLRVTPAHLLGEAVAPGQQEKPAGVSTSGLTQEQQEVIRLFAQAPPELRQAALAVLKSGAPQTPAQDEQE